MKILHTEASCGWGGQEIRILSEAQGMIGRGHEVSLVCPPRSRIYHEAPRFDVPATALPVGRKSLPGLLAMLKYLSQHRFDVINTHSSTDSWLAALACVLLPRSPTIVRTRHISAPISGNRGTRWLYAKATSRIATTGEALREELLSLLPLDPARIVSIPTGIDTDRFCPATFGERQKRRAELGLPDDLPIIGIVATLRSWKGHRYLIEAFAGSLARKARLVIVGEGPQQAPLIRQVEELGLNDRVLLVGGHHDVVPWLQAMDIFVLPSYANEGVPQALMQAMACALPCVTTSVGAIPEIARERETAMLVPAKDVEALARAVSTLLDDTALGKILGLNARRLIIEKYGKEAMLDRMESLFREASESRAAQ